MGDGKSVFCSRKTMLMAERTDVAVTRATCVGRHPESVEGTADEMEPQPDPLASVCGQSRKLDELPGAIARHGL